MLYSQQFQGISPPQYSHMCSVLTESFLFAALKESHHKLASSHATKGEGHHGDDHDDDEEASHSIIGLALVLGFVFMLLIDQIGSSRARGKQ